MENSKKISEVLKELRISHNYSIEILSSKTLVSYAYIKNFETDNFSKLPNFVFSLGLLKNLLEFFELSQTEITNYSKQFKKEFYEVESNKKDWNDEIPSQEEIKTVSLINEEDNSTNKKSNNKKFYIILVVIITIAILGLLLSNNIYSENNLRIEKNEKENHSTFSLYEKSDTFELKLGDKIKIFSSYNLVEFQLNEIKKNPENKHFLILESKTRKILIYLHQERYLDFNQDFKDDLIIKYQKKSGDVVVVTFTILNQNQKEINFDQVWKKNPSISLNPTGNTIILKNHFKSPIRVYLKNNFLPIHLSFNIEGKKQNQVNLKPYSFFSISAESHLTLQIGNYKSTKIIINNNPINLINEKSNAFSTTKIIKWVPNIHNETKFDLIIKDYIN